MSASQLTIDGREVDYRQSLERPRPWRRGPNQIAALLALELHGTLMSGRLGSEIHRLRRTPCKRPHPPGSKATTCCKGASSTGYGTARSLRRRGMVDRKETGWALT